MVYRARSFTLFVLLLVLPGLIAYACLPMACWFLQFDPAQTVMVSLLVGCVLVAHRRNLINEIGALGARINAEAKADKS